MFARWHNTRIKAAEKALEQGRLDDALTALREVVGVAKGQPGSFDPAGLLKLRDDARAQQLFDALVRPLIARARLHRQAGRHRSALDDLEAILALGRTDPDLQTLHTQVEHDLKHNTDRRADEARAVAKAAQQLEAGRLDTGRVQIDQVADVQARARLAAELDVRDRRTTEILQQASEALDHKDPLQALRLWQDACQRFGQSQETQRFVGRLSDACREFLDKAHRDGRLDVLLSAQSGMAQLAGSDPDLADCRKLIELCNRAVAQLTGRDFGGLRQTMLRIKAARSGVRWVDAAIEALSQIASAEDALVASPLGVQVTDFGRPVAAREAVAAPSAMFHAPIDTNAASLARPLLLLVDGGGSALLMAGDCVRIGRADSSKPVDVAIPADLDAHHADLLRRGDDYFLAAFGAALVNGRPAVQALLRDGDRVQLGATAKFTFQRPSARSGSAVLRLSHRCRLAGDVSDIVLLADTCLIGATTHCHVRTREEGGQVVLFDVGGRLHVRQTAGDNYLLDQPAPVRAGETIERGGLRVTVKNYDPARQA